MMNMTMAVGNIPGMDVTREDVDAAAEKLCAEIHGKLSPNTADGIPAEMLEVLMGITQQSFAAGAAWMQTELMRRAEAALVMLTRDPEEAAN